MASLSNGGFVLVFKDGIGQIFDSTGNPVGDTFKIYDETSGYEKSSVLGLSDGGFTVTYSKSYNGINIYARDYNSNRTAKGNEYMIVSETEGFKYFPIIIKSSFEKWMILYVSNLRLDYTLRLERESDLFKPFCIDFT